MDFRDPLHVVGFLIVVPGGIALAIYFPMLMRQRMRRVEWRRAAPAERVLAWVGAVFFEAVFLFGVWFGVWRAFLVN